MEASQHFEVFLRVVYDCVRDPTDEMVKVESRPLLKRMRGLKRLVTGSSVACPPTKKQKLSFILYLDAMSWSSNHSEF